MIINSESDRQIFDEDIALWDKLFSDNGNISIHVFDDISHFGYKIDTKKPEAVYSRAEFPKEVISAFADFIKANS